MSEQEDYENDPKYAQFFKMYGQNERDDGTPWTEEDFLAREVPPPLIIYHGISNSGLLMPVQLPEGGGWRLGYVNPFNGQPLTPERYWSRGLFSTEQNARKYAHNWGIKMWDEVVQNIPAPEVRPDLN